jgi:hypothetical protein
MFVSPLAHGSAPSWRETVVHYAYASSATPIRDMQEMSAGRNSGAMSLANDLIMT